MKTFFASVLCLLAVQVARAETTEKEIFSCQSQVEGFQNFRIIQTDEAADGQVKTSYQLKTGIIFFEEVWNQFGDAKWGEASPIFQSEFTRKYTPPVLPIPGVDPEPLPEADEYFMNVSINSSGSGSISVNSDLAPITCTKNQ